MRSLCAESTSAYCQDKEVLTRDADVPRRISFSASHWRVPAMPWLNRTSLLLFSGSSSHGNMPRCVLNATLNGATYRVIGASSMSGSAGDRDFGRRGARSSKLVSVPRLVAPFSGNAHSTRHVMYFCTSSPLYRSTKASRMQ